MAHRGYPDDLNGDGCAEDLYAAGTGNSPEARPANLARPYYSRIRRVNGDIRVRTQVRRGRTRNVIPMRSMRRPRSGWQLGDQLSNRLGG